MFFVETDSRHHLICRTRGSLYYRDEAAVISRAEPIWESLGSGNLGIDAGNVAKLAFMNRTTL